MVLLNSIPDSSYFTDPPLGSVNFGGSLRDFGTGVELFFGFHAPDKKGKHRQYEFRAQVAQESPPDQPFPPSEMTKYDFSGFNLVAQGKWGCTGGGSADFSITLVPQPPTP